MNNEWSALDHAHSASKSNSFSQGSGGNLLDIPEVEPWPETVDGALLLDELAGMLSRFVVLPPDAAEALALWSLHTYAFHLRDVTTYLGIESPEKRCGKTTLLSVLQQLVQRPISASNISSPALYRVIQETRPTLLIDEADTLLAGNDELRGILNAGYTRSTAFVVRVGHGGQARKDADTPETGLRPGGSQLLRFSCWCPKAIAAIGTLPETLADRSIVLRMKRKTPNEQSERLRRLETGNVRRCCARFVLDHATQIATGQPEVPPELHDRAADIWEPLLLLADLAGGDWPARARKAALTLTCSAVQHPPIRALLLDVLVAFYERRQPRLFSREIVDWLESMGDRPWCELKDARLLNERWLARQLRPYGIMPKTMWINGESARGYTQEDVMGVVLRYVPKSERMPLLDELGLRSQPPLPQTVGGGAATGREAEPAQGTEAPVSLRTETDRIADEVTL